MKLSKYIVQIPDMNNESILWFNTLSRSYFSLSARLSERISHVLQTEEFDALPEEFFNRLSQYKFIIDDNVDELEVIREAHRKASNSSKYTVQLLPTLNCNYNCWYCIQDHIPTLMSEKVMDKVLTHIEEQLKREEIKELRIEWFGGEPLMFVEQTVFPFSERLKTLCDSVGKSFTQGVTSNAYFLTEDVSKVLAQYNFDHFQITLDGNKENHDKVKFQKGLDSAFDRALEHIVKLLVNVPQMLVTLRINYTNEIVNQVCEAIPMEYRRRVTILPKKVWQEKPDETKRTSFEYIWDAFEEAGFYVRRNALIFGFKSCYTNDSSFVTINYNGSVLKCTACDDMYTKEGLGTLSDKGVITWNDNRGTDYDQPTFEMAECLKCVYLPLCMGVCPRDLVKNNLRCRIKLSDQSFDKEILAYVHEDKILRERARTDQ